MCVHVQMCMYMCVHLRVVFYCNMRNYMYLCTCKCKTCEKLLYTVHVQVLYIVLEHCTCTVYTLLPWLVPAGWAGMIDFSY